MSSRGKPSLPTCREEATQDATKKEEKKRYTKEEKRKKRVEDNSRRGEFSKRRKGVEDNSRRGEFSKRKKRGEDNPWGFPRKGFFQRANLFGRDKIQNKNLLWALLTNL